MVAESEKSNKILLKQLIERCSEKEQGTPQPGCWLLKDSHSQVV